MGFWVFMLVMDLMIPFMMIIFGKYFLKNAPKEINAVFGYRTAMSMKNNATWEFAHKYCGKLWYRWGLAMLPISVAAMLPVAGKSAGITGSVGGIICVIQTVFLVGSVFPTEKALKDNFDRDGKRRRI